MGNTESQPVPVKQKKRPVRRHQQNFVNVPQQKYNHYQQQQYNQQYSIQPIPQSIQQQYIQQSIPQSINLAQQQEQYLRNQYQKIQPNPSEFQQQISPLIGTQMNQLVKQYDFSNIDIINVNDKIKYFGEHEDKCKKEFNEEQDIRKKQFTESQKRQRDIFNREIQLFEKNHDPFKILGLDLDNFSLSKIKRAYKIKAQRNHPDKGGDPEIFKKITQAYCYLINKYGQEEEYDYKMNKEVTNEEYDSHLNDGYENIHISKDNFNINKFNDTFNQHRIKNAFDNGYGDLMSKDPRTDESIDVKSIFNDQKFNVEIFNKTFADDKSSDELIIYDEPQALQSSGGFYQELGQGKIKDFGSSDGNLQFTDYKKAYSKDIKFIDPDSVKYREYKNLDELKTERSNVSHNLSIDDKEKLRVRELHEQEFEKKRQNRIKKEEERYNQQFNQLNRLFIRE